MTDFVTIKGNLGAAPKYSSKSGVPITRFNVGSTERRFNRAKGEWEDGHTNWHRIVVFRDQARNAAVSLAKGSAVVIHGRIRNRRINQGTDAEPKWLYLSEVEADHVGVDLTRGFVNYFPGVAAEPPQSESGNRGEPAVDQALPGPPEPTGVEAGTGVADPAPSPRETAVGVAWGSSFDSSAEAGGDDAGEAEETESGDDPPGERQAA